MEENQSQELTAEEIAIPSPPVEDVSGQITPSSLPTQVQVPDGPPLNPVMVPPEEVQQVSEQVSVSVPVPVPQTISPTSTTSLVKALLMKAQEKIQFNRNKKLSRIMEYVTSHKSIANDQVEKLLHVSNRTATRYLQLLAKEGKLKRVGTTGREVRYEMI